MSLTTGQEGLTHSTRAREGQAGVSPALEWLWQHLRDVRQPHILDCGPVSQATVDVLLRRGAKLYVADLVSPAQRGEVAYWDRSGRSALFRLEAFLAQVPNIPFGSLSAVFGWHLLDLLPRESHPALINRLCSYLQPSGVLFCLLREPYLPKGYEAAWRLESLTRLAPDRGGSKPFPYPAVSLREIERLLPCGGLKTFLARSGHREVLAIK